MNRHSVYPRDEEIAKRFAGCRSGCARHIICRWNLPNQLRRRKRSPMPEHKHTNRLVNETSPYLLQHVHNPVEWYPWGEEALEKARRENKPILLSIGYSAC